MLANSCLLAYKSGALGNRLIQAATAIAFAREHDLTIYNLALDQYAHLFDGSRRDLFARFPSQPSRLRPTLRRRRQLYRIATVAVAALYRLDRQRRLAEIVRLDWDEHAPFSDFLDVARSRRPLVFQGWFFTEPSIESHAFAIRDYLTPVEPIRAGVSNVVQRARQGQPLIGVHARRSDYGVFLGGRYLYSLAQYEAVLRDLNELFGGRCSFLIASDDPRMRIGLDRDGSTVLTGAPVEDLYALAACDYLVGPPSTFSIWASFYGSVPLFKLFTPEAPRKRADFAVQATFGQLLTEERIPQRGRDVIFEAFLGPKAHS